ncbi:MAG: anthranilate synthase component I family protein [Elusimicrobiota bacterium]|jgi:anthranilate/para-aminobenzoate synthase component I
MYPSFNQFARWASQYRAVPIWIEPELPGTDLLDWVHSLAGAQQRFFFLHSASAGTQARYSYIALDSPRYSVELDDQALVLRYHADNGARQDALKIGNPYQRFHDWFRLFTGPRVDGLPPFWGGAVGYLGYESAQYVDPKLKSLFSARPKAQSLALEHFGDLEFGVFDAVAIVDHARGRLWIVHTLLLPEARTLSPNQLERIYRQAQDRLRRYAIKLQRAVHQPRAWGTFHTGDICSNCSEAAYRLMVRRAKGLIAAGDIYQGNLSHVFSSTWEGDPWSLYRQLSAINPSPYAALWRSGSRWMLSASPELLLRQEADHVETRPIAGTYPREFPSDDRQVAQTLLRDTKERAEHIMLVDLERNDLGRVCQSPSVQVSEALTQEIYSHVVHLVSDVRGRLAPNKTWLDTLRACFPGGTITGCPKLRAIEVLHKLEPHRRGPYTGSLGWIGFNGDITFNILIRTFFMDKGRMSFAVGAGIVADSDPLREYHETLYKAQALLQALQEQGAIKPPPTKLL